LCLAVWTANSSLLQIRYFSNYSCKNAELVEHDHHKIMNQYDIQGLLYIPKEDDLKISISEITGSKIQQDRDLGFWV
jgi:hypothetical protein